MINSVLFWISGIASAAVVFFAIGRWGGGRALGVIVLLYAIGFGAIVTADSAFPFYLGPGWAVGFAIWIFTLPAAMLCILFEKRIATLFGRSTEA